MANRLQIKRNVYGTSGAPAAATLLTGEMAWDGASEKLYIGKQTANNGVAADVTVFDLNAAIVADVPIATASAVGTLKPSSDDFGITGAGLLTLATTSTAAELNLLDTAVAGTVVNSKAVIYGSGGQVDATILEIGGTAVTSTAAELNLVDGITPGTAAASKAVILDSNKDLSGIRNFVIAGNLTVSGTTTTVESTTVAVADKDIMLAKNITAVPGDSSLKGAGIIFGANASAPSFLWDNSGGVDMFKFNKPVQLTVSGTVNTGSILDFGTYAT